MNATTSTSKTPGLAARSQPGDPPALAEVLDRAHAAWERFDHAAALAHVTDAIELANTLGLSDRAIALAVALGDLEALGEASTQEVEVGQFRGKR